MLDSRSQLPLAESIAGAVRLTGRAASLAAFFLCALLAGATSPFAAERLVAPDELSRNLTIENLSVQGDRVAGVVVNLSDRPVRDVRLRIVYSWLWADDLQGTNDPSFAVIESIPDVVPPRGPMTFGYRYPSANTVRSDGRFIVEVRIIGYGVVGEMYTTP